ncbi:hypothetical protein [Phyllobacterium zundukense]|uniref:Uncharacterized protein n=1 Tax=Phyllobacterium zundukense TaxID=1867719 RepID=A0ACD4CYT1_9HYPH|nr:hypothetical protein [Phyllobacterium zundukense]UXN58682.1 hypothetical protein N8E88_11920 [Phyllobacterium zundukense]
MSRDDLDHTGLAVRQNVANHAATSGSMRGKAIVGQDNDLLDFLAAVSTKLRL